MPWFTYYASETAVPCWKDVSFLNGKCLNDLSNIEKALCTGSPSRHAKSASSLSQLLPLNAGSNQHGLNECWCWELNVGCHLSDVLWKFVPKFLWLWQFCEEVILPCGISFKFDIPILCCQGLLKEYTSNSFLKASWNCSEEYLFCCNKICMNSPHTPESLHWMVNYSPYFILSLRQPVLVPGQKKAIVWSLKVLLQCGQKENYRLSMVYYFGQHTIKSRSKIPHSYQGNQLLQWAQVLL